MRQVVSAVLAIVFVWGAVSVAVAVSPEIERRWRLRYDGVIPEYCKYAQVLPDKSPGAFDDPYAETVLKPRYGEAFRHIHHYCMGLHKLYLASSMSDLGHRISSYQAVVDEINYVLERAPPDFVLLPELYQNRGLAQMAMGLHVESVESFARAIELDPSSEAAYIGLASCLERLGGVERAKEILRQGVEAIPDSSYLRSRLSELERGGPG